MKSAQIRSILLGKSFCVGKAYHRKRSMAMRKCEPGLISFRTRKSVDMAVKMGKNHPYVYIPIYLSEDSSGLLSCQWSNGTLRPVGGAVCFFAAELFGQGGIGLSDFKQPITMDLKETNRRMKKARNSPRTGIFNDLKCDSSPGQATKSKV